MQEPSTYTPEWIKESDVCHWLGVDKSTLYRWRQQFGLAYSAINGRNIMYDKKQIIQILNTNSTYAYSGDKKLTA